jgi:hypothetical protein
MPKYLIKHWINVDVIAEKIVNDENLTANEVEKKHSPDSTFEYKMIKGSEKINRTTYEEYGKNINDSSTKPISDK